MPIDPTKKFWHYRETIRQTFECLPRLEQKEGPLRGRQYTGCTPTPQLFFLPLPKWLFSSLGWSRQKESNHHKRFQGSSGGTTLLSAEQFRWNQQLARVIPSERRRSALSVARCFCMEVDVILNVQLVPLLTTPPVPNSFTLPVYLWNRTVVSPVMSCLWINAIRAASIDNTERKLSQRLAANPLRCPSHTNTHIHTQHCASGGKCQESSQKNWQFDIWANP